VIAQAELQRFVGRKVREENVATAFPVRALVATLGREEATPAEGEPIPDGWHDLYFAETPRAGTLTPDGLAADSPLFPALPEFPRRMFANQQMRFHEPVRIGDRLTRESELTDATLKQGATGAMIFCTIGRRISGPRGLAVEEQYVRVLREAVAPGAGNPASRREAPPDGLPWHASVTVDVPMLFRYSALTFNAHRIHYDREWATGAEGYPGLVVQGPLSMTLLLNFARDNMGRRLSGFAMRARAPLFDIAPFSLVGRPAGERSAEVWAVTPEGTVAMSASAEFA
jgi:3-methylfumaryl-CoA hydratase